jgi:hypothetical protein
LPDGESEIFLRKGLDSDFEKRPDGQINRPIGSNAEEKRKALPFSIGKNGTTGISMSQVGTSRASRNGLPMSVDRRRSEVKDRHSKQR